MADGLAGEVGQIPMGGTEASPRVPSERPMPIPVRDSPGPGRSRGRLHPTYYRLSKLSLEDDIEAYLYTFETTATAARWPPAQWVTILVPYLTGP